MDDGYRIRAVEAADAEALAGLEHACFSDPWSLRAMRDTLASHSVVGVVAVSGDGDLPVGYLLAAAAAGGAEILTLGVDPAHRRRGIAGRLLATALDALRARGVAEVWLEVRESNRPAQALYAGFGFAVAGMRRAYYRSPTEDALVFRLALTAPA